MGPSDDVIIPGETTALATGAVGNKILLGRAAGDIPYQAKAVPAILTARVRRERASGVDQERASDCLAAEGDIRAAATGIDQIEVATGIIYDLDGRVAGDRAAPELQRGRAAGRRGIADFQQTAAVGRERDGTARDGASRKRGPERRSTGNGQRAQEVSRAVRSKRPGDTRIPGHVESAVDSKILDKLIPTSIDVPCIRVGRAGIVRETEGRRIHRAVFDKNSVLPLGPGSIDIQRGSAVDSSRCE